MMHGQKNINLHSVLHDSYTFRAAHTSSITPQQSGSRFVHLRSHIMCPVLQHFQLSVLQRRVQIFWADIQKPRQM